MTALGWSSGARAQKNGYYSGSNSVGGAVTFNVNSIIGGGQAVFDFEDGGVLYCHGLYIGSYYNNASGPFFITTGRKASVLADQVNSYISAKMKFEGDSVTGTVILAMPVFTDSKEPPRKTCSAATVPVRATFTATFLSEDSSPRSGANLARNQGQTTRGN